MIRLNQYKFLVRVRDYPGTFPYGWRWDYPWLWRHGALVVVKGRPCYGIILSPIGHQLIAEWEKERQRHTWKTKP